MDKQHSWKRTEDIEIDLFDLLYKIFRHWKQAAACALVFAVFLGGYGYLKEKRIQEVLKAHNSEDAELTEEDEQSVIAAIELEAEISGLQEYLDNSILMQLDPYHKNCTVLLYSIECKNGQKLQQTAESYLSFITNGGAADAIKESKSGISDMDKSYLAELIKGYQKTNTPPYQVSISGAKDSKTPAETFFYVELIGKDTEMAKSLALGMQEALKKHSRTVKVAGGHSLTLLSSEESMVADSDLQTQQHAKRTLLTTNLASLKTMLNAFSEQQMAVYEDAAGPADKQDGGGETVASANSYIGIKYMILGLAGGVFVYSIAFGCWYLYCDTLKSSKEMKRLYTFSYYGSIFLEDVQKRKGPKPVIAGNGGGSIEKVQVLNRVRLACKKHGIVRLCMASDFSFSRQEKECLDGLAEQLKNCGVDVFIAEKASSDAGVWDILAETGNVLIVSKIGTTTHGAVDEEMEFYLENGITVVGAVAFAAQR